MQLNYEQAKLHCELLTGDSNSPLTFQFFYDVKGQLQRPDLAQHFVSTLDNAWNRIINAQQNHCGIYIGVNATDGVGRKNENIIKYRALFVDFDGSTEPQWMIEPSFVSMRDATHGHAYWSLADGELTDPGEFKAAQKRLSLFYGTDEQVTDPARVLRLCGSVHYKNPVLPAQYNIARVSSRVNTRYSIKDLIECHTLAPEKDAELHKWIETRKGNMVGTGYSENDRYIGQLIRWASINAPAAVAGSGSGNLTLYKVFSWAHDHGIPIGIAQGTFWEHYAPRCEPPFEDWQQEQFNETLTNAYTHAQSVPGCKTAVAEFKALGELPPPIGGWEANIKIIEPVRIKPPVITSDNTETKPASDIRINRDDAGLMLPQITVKSGHFDLAVVFDGMMFNGNEIIRSEKQFYVTNGKSWKEYSDDNIKAMILNFYSDFRPPDSFTRGVFNVFCDLVNQPFVKNGMWLSDPKRDGSNIVVFSDGIIDFSEKAPYILKPHSVDYFNFSEVDYVYDIGSKTPHWDAFLKSIWPNNPENIILLHEWLGYCLTNSTNLQKFMLFIGLSRAGKGVITTIIAYLLGRDNICSPSLQNLTKDSILHQMSTSKHAFINDAHSVSYGARDSTLSQFKAITGNDPITFHRMYKGAMSLPLPCRITMSTNNMPEFIDSTGALLNRALVLPFRESFAGREDVELVEKLKGEIAGIAQKAIAGYIRLQSNNGVFTTSHDGELEREDLKEDMFPLAQFVRTCCELRTGAVTSVDELFAVYSYWCTVDGVKMPYTKTQLSKQLKNSSLGLRKVRIIIDGHKVGHYEGIRVSREITDILSNRQRFPAVS